MLPGSVPKTKGSSNAGLPFADMTIRCLAPNGYEVLTNHTAFIDGDQFFGPCEDGCPA